MARPLPGNNDCNLEIHYPHVFNFDCIVNDNLFVDEYVYDTNEGVALPSSFNCSAPDINLCNTADNFMGGKIGDFKHVWFRYSKCSWTRAVLAGDLLEFDTLPSRLSVRPLRLSRGDQCALDVALSDFVRRRIVEEVLEPGNDSYMSNVFPVLKRDGVTARVILNLKPLNPHIVYRHFKMDGLASVLPLISPGCWFASLDLMDAYFSVPVALSDRKWLRFRWYDRIYQYTCMPQGLTSAPRIFTRLLKPIMSHFRSLGITTMIYIDDCLVIAPTAEELRVHVVYVCQVFDSLGLTVHESKSQLSPVQVIDYLGFRLDSVNMSITLSSHKMDKIRDLGSFLLASGRVSLRVLASFIGNVVAAGPGVPLAPLKYKYLEILRNRGLAASGGDFDASVVLDDRARSLILWWIQGIHSQFRSLLSLPPNVVLTTDASLSGWGAVMGSDETGGHWAQSELEHINVLELRAVLLGLQSLCGAVRDSHIWIVSDNTTVVACIEKGCSIRARLMDLIEEIYEWASVRCVSLSAEYLKGSENVTADRLSREVVYSTEWRLIPEIFDKLCDRYGSPGVDLFATRLNFQLPVYVSWKPDPMAARVDAFSFTWDPHVLNYAFPPFSVLGRVLRKVVQERVDVLLVAPVWPTQVWFPMLLELLAAVPVYLPRRCLSLPQDLQAAHPMGDRLGLAGMIISGDPLRRREFRRRLQPFFANLGGMEQGLNTDGMSIGGSSFVSSGMLIRFGRL